MFLHITAVLLCIVLQGSRQRYKGATSEALPLCWCSYTQHYSQVDTLKEFHYRFNTQLWNKALFLIQHLYEFNFSSANIESFYSLLKQAPSLKRFHVSKMDANLWTSTMQQFVFQPFSHGVASQHSSVLNYSVLYSAFLFWMVIGLEGNYTPGSQTLANHTSCLTRSGE